MSRNYELLRRAEKERLCARSHESGFNTAVESPPGSPDFARHADLSGVETATPPDGAVQSPNDQGPVTSISEVDREAVVDREADILRPGAVLPSSLHKEEISRLVQRLFLLPGSPKPISTAVFSAVEEDKSTGWLTACVANVLAQHTSKLVCLLDANLRSPSLHTFFGLPNEAGLTGATSNSAANVNATRVTSNLWLVSSGRRASSGEAVLLPDRMQRAVQGLQTRFDYVIIDAPPLGTSNDAIVLGKLCDGLVMVIEAHSTRRERAQKLKESLEFANVRLLGAVLNNRTLPIPQVLYSWL